MMTTPRPRNGGASFANRRGHAPQLSITDPSHHVTEAIGTMYGSDDEDGISDARSDRSSTHRPLSFFSPVLDNSPNHQRQTGGRDDDRRGSLVRTTSDTTQPMHPASTRGKPKHVMKKAQTLPARMSMARTHSYENGGLSPISPASPISLKEVQAAEESNAQFTLDSIGDPSDIAQELSNLQALRRMSMDVGNLADPDLPLQMSIPAIAPSGDDDETDPSRLMWVPANVHPELAPEQFKNFLERRVNSMKRRSAESTLSVDGAPASNGNLMRKKSTLSRQINTAGGYTDGADRLAGNAPRGAYATPELDFDELVKNPVQVAQRLAHQAQVEQDGPSDMPILPVAPGMGLKRSKHTQYRKGGSLRGDRLPFSKRVANRQAEGGGLTDEASSSSSLMSKLDSAAVQESTESQPEAPLTENFSRPMRSVRRQQNFTRENNMPDADTTSFNQPEGLLDASRSTHSQQGLTGTALEDSTTSAVTTIPQIIETPPIESLADPQFPARSSSQRARDQLAAAQQTPLKAPPRPSSARQPDIPVQPPPPPRSPARPASGRLSPIPKVSIDNVASEQSHTMRDIVNHTSQFPSAANSRTDDISIIPTLPESALMKPKPNEPDSSRLSSGWKWFKSEDKEKKKKDKERERERQQDQEIDQARKTKSKLGDKPHEIARLDVIQNSLEHVVAKGRESLLLDRESIDNKLSEERKKESKKATEPKKEKDGFFGSIFGGSKRRSDRDSFGRKSGRNLSPEPPPRILQPDIDFPYTRFPILEERAIYRMAHIKLANPKRNLMSQVLLSNFMYSYLAKIQAMHPQMHVPVSPQQKRLEEERKRKEEEQTQIDLQMLQQQHEQDQAQSSIDQYNFEYHRTSNQYTDSGVGNAGYSDEPESYDYVHHGGGGSSGGNGHDGSDGYVQQDGQYYEHDPYEQHQQQQPHHHHQQQQHQHQQQQHHHHHQHQQQQQQGYYGYDNQHGAAHSQGGKHDDDDMW